MADKYGKSGPKFSNPSNPIRGHISPRNPCNPWLILCLLPSCPRGKNLLKTAQKVTHFCKKLQKVVNLCQKSAKKCSFLPSFLR
jgi:hypothetical protein